ncbi:MAG: TlpA family protein disulfide reductase [Flavobacteriaceae bacterium]|nr:TlpA family protein disulfide reductase [Flavobacteriaceae bacterium]
MKKNILLALLLISIIACNKKEASFVTFAGEIKNTNNADTLLTIANREFTKSMLIKNGVFKDTLTINKPGYYNIFIAGKNFGYTFLRNGFDLELTADKNAFFETVQYSGNGAQTANYLLAQAKVGNQFGNPTNVFALDKDAFIKKIETFKFKFDSIKKVYKELDTMMLRTNNAQNEQFFSAINQAYERQHAALKAKENLAAGKVSPTFSNYTNYKGGKTSLADFKGKFVYIDIWATWCKPCLAQIPALQDLEKKYHQKNIAFVSISVDNDKTSGSWDNAKKSWKKMVSEKNLTGVQLFAGEDIEFLKNYQVSSIPRFILIDPKGNIINSNAPRPTDVALEDLFKSSGI